MSTLPPDGESSTAPSASSSPAQAETTTSIPALDPQQARQMLLVLGGSPDAVFAFQTFSERPGTNGQPALIQVIHGTFDACVDRLITLNEQGASVYVTVNRTDGNGRRAENIVACRASYIDHDEDKDGPLREPLREPPTITVFSGHGWHHYWIYESPESTEGFTTLQQQLITTYGTDPNVHDLPRVMRLPGFVNWKSTPILARVTEIRPGVLYTGNYLREIHSTPVVDPMATAPSATGTTGTKKIDFPPADHQKILDGCPWYRQCQENASTLTEPNWFAQMQIAVRCGNGRVIGHELSSPYPRYSEAETDKKLDHAATFGPPTCTYVEGTLKYAGCQTCRHRGRIKAPIVLGSSQAASVMSIDDARASATAAVALLTDGKVEEFMAGTTFEALAALPESERDQQVVRIRKVLADNKKIAKLLSLSTFNKRLSKATARHQKESAKAEQASAKAAIPTSLLPRIVAEGRPFRDICDEALTAIIGANKPSPMVYVQASSLVRVTLDTAGSYLIGKYVRASMRGHLAHVADFIVERISSGEFYDAPVTPSNDIVDDVLNRGEWPDLPALVGISPIPIARSDGTFHMEPGYDNVTGLIYLPGSKAGIPLIPDQPTKADVENAIIVLWEPFREFPWIDGSAKAHVFALILTLILRPAIDGHVPLVVMLSNLPGSGKTLLLELIVTLVYGQSYWSSFPYQTSEDETRKRITSALLEGRPVVVIDNAEGTINSAALASVVTSAQWCDRILGGNRNASVRNLALWILNGNNITTGDDLNRRSFVLEMRSLVEHPHLRDSFTIKNVRQWVQQHREQLLSAALILVRNWHLKGCPPPSVPAVMGNFEAWCQTIGGVLSAAGVDGFLTNATRVRELCEGLSTQWGGFLQALFLRYLDQPFAIHMLCEEMPDRRDKLAAPGFRLFEETLPNELAAKRDKGEGTLQHGLGQAFKKIINTPYREFTLRKAGTDQTSHVITYSVSCGNISRLPEPHRSAMYLVSWLRTCSWWSLPENRGRSEASDIMFLAGSFAINSVGSSALPILPEVPVVSAESVAALVQWLRFLWSAVTSDQKPMSDALITTTSALIFGEGQPS